MQERKNTIYVKIRAKFAKWSRLRFGECIPLVVTFRHVFRENRYQLERNKFIVTKYMGVYFLLNGSLDLIFLENVFAEIASFEADLLNRIQLQK